MNKWEFKSPAKLTHLWRTKNIPRKFDCRSQVPSHCLCVPKYLNFTSTKNLGPGVGWCTEKWMIYTMGYYCQKAEGLKLAAECRTPSLLAAEEQTVLPQSWTALSCRELRGVNGWPKSLQSLSLAAREGHNGVMRFVFRKEGLISTFSEVLSWISRGQRDWTP